MVRFNSDVVFTDSSGQIRSTDGDLTLRVNPVGGSVIVGDCGALRPEAASTTDLGTDALPWKDLHANGGEFATRPKVSGSGVLLQGETHGELASYSFNGFASVTGTSFTPIPWSETLVEESIYSRVGSSITVLADGVYSIDFSVNLTRNPSAAALFVESRLQVNGTFIAAYRAFSTFYPDVTLPLQAVQTTKQLAIPLSSGDVLQVGSNRLFTAGSFFHLLGSTIRLSRR